MDTVVVFVELGRVLGVVVEHDDLEHGTSSPRG
jgi:hypothetical protein